MSHSTRKVVALDRDIEEIAATLDTIAAGLRSGRIDRVFFVAHARNEPLEWSNWFTEEGSNTLEQIGLLKIHTDRFFAHCLAYYAEVQDNE